MIQESDDGMRAAFTDMSAKRKPSSYLTNCKSKKKKNNLNEAVLCDKHVGKHLEIDNLYPYTYYLNNLAKIISKLLQCRRRDSECACTRTRPSVMTYHYRRSVFLFLFLFAFLVHTNINP